VHLWVTNCPSDSAACAVRAWLVTRQVTLPRITVMQAEQVARPFHRDGWIYEEKYDGWRMAA